MDALQRCEEDQPIFIRLSSLKKQALLDRMERKEQENHDSMRWMANRMQEDGLRRGLDKEQRENMTIGDLLDK